MASVALESLPQPRKLRVGVFADARLQPRWLVEAFADVARSDCAEIVALSIEERAADGVARQAAPWLERAYRRIDRWAFGADYCEPVDLAAHVAHRQLSRPDLDVAFALGALDDAALDGIARLGVWRLRVDGFGEVARGEPLTGAALIVRLAAGAIARIAYESWGRTDALSVARNRRALAQKSAQIPLRALREAQRSGRGWLEQCRPTPGYEEKATLSVVSMGKRVLGHAVEKAAAVEQWALAFRFGALTPDLEGFTRIVPPRGRNWCDPCALEHQGRHYVFFADGGSIAQIEIAADGRCSAPQRVLERDYPLSHPFVFEHEGRLYLIPETAARRTVELYRCVEFPLRWELERVLLEGVGLADAVFHRAAERCWVFANGHFDDELHLFHARHPLGDWQPHRRNPVKSDARSSRPAGRLYWRNGVLCRPAQISVPRHGAGVAINRVLRLTPEDYAERQVERIFPPRGVAGMHTVNRAGALTVVDVRTRRSRFA
jgi:hypothetical protein